MGGSKKKNKGLTPSKRREAAKQALQDRFKMESDIKQLVKTIEVAEKDRITIENEKKDLVRWAEERLKQRNEGYAMYDNKNGDPRTKGIDKILPNNESEKLDLGEIRRRAILIRNFTAHMGEEKTRMENKFTTWSTAFMELLHKHKLTRDMIVLRQLHRSEKKDALQERKDSLEKRIKKLQFVYTDIAKLDKERQRDQNNITLEEYMDYRIKALHDKIKIYKDNIQHAIKGMVRVKNWVSDRQQKIHDLNVTIKNKPNASIKESKEYQTVCNDNKQLLLQLEQLTREREQIAEATQSVRNAISEEEQSKSELTDDEIEMKHALKVIEKQYEETLFREPFDEEITEELRKQVWSRDASLAHLQNSTEKLKESVKQEKETVTLLKNDIEEVDEYNRSMLKKISTDSALMMADVTYKCSF